MRIPCPASPTCPHHVDQNHPCPTHGQGPPAANIHSRAWRTIRARYLHKHPTCSRCGRPGTEVNHRYPRRLGGTDQDHNLETLCNPCHRKHSATVEPGLRDFYRT